MKKVRVKIHGVPALRKESAGAKRGFSGPAQPADLPFFRKAHPFSSAIASPQKSRRQGRKKLPNILVVSFFAH
ncbi:MAG: hypothetical protein JSV89_12255 [Spirochaetaceae bacterium]|nr:MAG: hypothetical protein JSV89_12255 [Spirochaetaceae bacterium]